MRQCELQYVTLVSVNKKKGSVNAHVLRHPNSVITQHAQGKMIGAGVHIYIYLYHSYYGNSHVIKVIFSLLNYDIIPAILFSLFPGNPFALRIVTMVLIVTPW